VVLGDSAHRIQGSLSPSFESLLRYVARALEERPALDVADIVAEGTPMTPVSEVVDLVRELLEAQTIHIAGLHTLPGERPSLEDVILESGPPPKKPGETVFVKPARLIVQVKARRAIVDGEKVELTRRQAEILAKLAQNPQAWMPYEELKRLSGSGERPDLVFKSLSKRIEQFVRRVPGKGVMLDIPSYLVRVEHE
jgi:hypothetical protein